MRQSRLVASLVVLFNYKALICNHCLLCLSAARVPLPSARAQGEQSALVEKQFVQIHMESYAWL